MNNNIKYAALPTYNADGNVLGYVAMPCYVLEYENELKARILPFRNLNDISVENDLKNECTCWIDVLTDEYIKAKEAAFNINEIIYNKLILDNPDMPFSCAIKDTISKLNQYQDLLDSYYEVSQIKK